MTYEEGVKVTLFMWFMSHKDSMEAHEWFWRETIGTKNHMSPMVADMLPPGAHGSSRTYSWRGLKESNPRHHNCEDIPIMISKHIVPILVFVVGQIDPATAPGLLKISPAYRRLARAMTHKDQRKILEGEIHD